MKPVSQPPVKPLTVASAAAAPAAVETPKAEAPKPVEAAEAQPQTPAPAPPQPAAETPPEEPASSEPLTRPTLLVRVPATYPREELAAGNTAGGVVVLGLHLDETGVPRNIRVMRSLGQYFDRNAEFAARQWRFRPAMRGDTPVPSNVRVEISFQVEGRGNGRRSLRSPR